MTLAGLLPLLTSGPTRVGSLAVPAVPLAAATLCAEVDDYFGSDAERSSLLILDPQGKDRVGLVSRPHFLHAMAGPFGFGRALLSKHPVAEVAEWNPVVLEADSSIQHAALAVLQRPAEARYDELVVRWPTAGWATLSAAAVLEALSRLLARQAMIDALTGLANREVLLDELTQALARPRPHCLTALVFIDLDRFKQINDEHGHIAGDRMLQAVARRLRAVARPGDLVARLGGDEFAVVLTLPLERDVDPVRTADDIAQRLLADILQPVHVGSAILLVGASMGVAVSSPAGSDPDTLLREADLAMYRAKRAGGDRIDTVAAVGTQLVARAPAQATGVRSRSGSR